MSTSVRDSRLDMRLPADQKSLLERAAALAGVSLSAFAIDAMLSKANEVIASHETTRLSTVDWDLFLQALDADEPNATLSAAARRYRTG